MFRQFLSLCAGRIGQIVNFLDLGNILGIDSKTVKAWISILEASFVVFLLSPFYKNYDKHIVKSSKLYFYDTGVACSLLNIQSEDQIQTHFGRGSLFENMVILELLKKQVNVGRLPDFYFWQSSHKREIDLLVPTANGVNALEIKAGKTLNSSFFGNLHLFDKIATDDYRRLALIYGGDQQHTQSGVEVFPWNKLDELNL